MGIAKPQAIEKILYHMANVGNLTKAGRTTAELAEKTGQQRLPLYPESFMKDFDQILGAMNEDKVRTIAANLISPEEHRRVMKMSNPPQSAYFAWPDREAGFTGGVALPEQTILEYGPTAISHEGRHLEVARGVYGSQRQPVFVGSDTNPDALYVRRDSGQFESIANKSDFTGIHHEPTLEEFDAAMSEVGTLMKAGDYGMKTAKFYGGMYPEFAKIKKRDYSLLWKLLPKNVQDEYIRTAALAGVAFPSIGAFQPQTQD